LPSLLASRKHSLEVEDTKAHKLDQGEAFIQGQGGRPAVSLLEFLCQVHFGNLPG